MKPQAKRQIVITIYPSTPNRLKITYASESARKMLEVYVSEFGSVSRHEDEKSIWLSVIPNYDTAEVKKFLENLKVEC